MRLEQNMHVTLNEMRQVFPAGLLQRPNRVLVAGGYAADSERATDVDLWLPEGDAQEMAEFTRTVWPKLEGFSNATLAGAMFAAEYEDSLKARGIGRMGSIVHTASGKTLQVFWYSHETPHEMLSEFDISTHQVGVDLVTGERIALPTTTSVSQLPRVTDWSTPQTTLVRLKKLLLRYGFYEGYHLHPDMQRLRDLTSSTRAA
jgi:hypothetical protein